MDPKIALRPWLVSIAVASALYWTLKRGLKHDYKASVLLSLGLILFFSYGQVYDYLEMAQPLGLMLGRHRYLAPTWLLLLGLGAWWILRIVKDHTSITQAINISAAALLLLPIGQIASFSLSRLTARESRSDAAQIGSLTPTDPDDRPDIYLIILDKYARQDVLFASYGIDNRPFLTELVGLGFYVAECSQSNYDHSESSLASELNYEYIQNLLEVEPQETDHSLLWPLIKQSEVRRQLAALGYQTIAFETGYPWSQIEDADLYLRPPTRSSLLSQIQPFEAMLVNTTALSLLADSQVLMAQGLSQDAYYLHYSRELFMLRALEELPTMDGPKFVFAHVLIPHEPYVFMADGSLQTDSAFYRKGWGQPIDDQHDYEGYRNQIAFINDRIISIIKALIRDSKTPPIILLQSDHGIAPARNANLGAYYLPGGNAEGLYAGISSVNIFRVVFNTYFGTHYPLLPDHAYTSQSLERLYDLSISSDTLPTCPE
jgi:hypothetical protein